MSSGPQWDGQTCDESSLAAATRPVPTGLTKTDLDDGAQAQTPFHGSSRPWAFPALSNPPTSGRPSGSAVRNRAELESGLQQAAALKRLVVEKGVSARELECAVLGKAALHASVVGEVRFDADWYDYATKYSDGTSTTLIPAPLPDDVSTSIREQALKACAAVGVDGMARVDFFLEPDTMQVWINEINTLPGFTDQSMYPMLWKASGLTLEQLVHELVQTAGE